MRNLSARLAKLEAVSAERQAAEDAAIIRQMVDFIEAQPPADAAAFWRVNRQRYTPADRSPDALQVCGGVFALQPGDRDVYQRLTDEFFNGGYGRPASEPDPAPVPALEVA